MNVSDFKAALDHQATRVSLAKLRERFPDNRILHLIASANLRRSDEYRCLIEGEPFIVTREERKSGGIQ